MTGQRGADPCVGWGVLEAPCYSGCLFLAPESSDMCLLLAGVLWLQVYPHCPREEATDRHPEHRAHTVG